MNNFKKNKGFTLLELLIAIALSSIVLFGVFQGYFVFKKMTEKYFQTIRLQNNLRLITHKLYQITDRAGQFGCANTNTSQQFYLHVSKNIPKNFSQLLFFDQNIFFGLKWLKKTDAKVKFMLSDLAYQRAKIDSDIIYTVHAQIPDKKNNNPSVIYYPVYSNCHDIFILSSQDNPACVIENKQVSYIGNLAMNLYFVAKSQRTNNQDVPIYSLHHYNHADNIGAQEILEGVESMQPSHPAVTKVNQIKILLNSVEGNPPVKQWLTVAM